MSIHVDSPGTSKSCKDFFPAHSQSPEISNFGNILAISEQPNPSGLFGYS